MYTIYYLATYLLVAGLYTYCLRDGDHFVLESRHVGECYTERCPAGQNSPDKKRQRRLKRSIFLDTVI